MSINETNTNVKRIVNAAEDVVYDFQRDARESGKDADKIFATVKPKPTLEVQQVIATTVSPPAGSFITEPVPAPTAPDVSFIEPQKANITALAGVNSFVKSEAPEEDVDFYWNATSFNPGAKPDIDYGTAPSVVVPEVAPMDQGSAPIKPSFSVVTAPEFGGLTLPNLAVTLKPSSLPTLSDKFSYSENPFSPTVLNSLVTNISEVLNGRLGVPGWVCDASWSRGAANINRKTQSNLYEAQKEFASMGWDMPGLALMARRAAAIQEGNQSINDLTRESVVKQTEQQREDFWNAMQQGVACEQLLLQAHSQWKERLLRAAIEANNSGIAVYNAAVQAYQVTEIAAKDLLIRAKDLELRGSLAELQVFEAELKAAGFHLEVDKNKIAIYTAEWQGEAIRAQTYAAYVEGIKAYVQAQATAVQAYGTQVQAANTKLQGWAMEWDAHAKSFEESKVQIAAQQARNSLFSNRVQYFMATSQAEKSRVDSDIETRRLSLSSMQLELDEYKTLWSGIQTKMEALTRVYATDAQVYSAKGQYQTSKLGSYVGLYQAQIQSAGQHLQAQTENAKNDLTAWQTTMQSWDAYRQAAAGTYAQLGSAAYAASSIHIGASGSFGVQYGESDSWSRNYSMSGSVAYTGGSIAGTTIEFDPALPSKA